MKGNPTTREGLRALGFKLLAKIGQLQKEPVILCHEKRLQSPGVYAIVCPAGYEHSFLELQETYKQNNVIKPKGHDKLKARWVEGVDVLYFGKTERLLRYRLAELVSHSLGLTTQKGPHKGGEIVWQLKDYEIFDVFYLPTENPTQAKQMESDLISKFYKLTPTHKLPFANKNPPRKH